MQINWEKWQAIEVEHNRRTATVEFLKERLAEAEGNVRNCFVAIHRAIGMHGLFRRIDQAQWLQDLTANPEAMLAQYRDHDIGTLLGQYCNSRLKKDRAADALAKEQSALSQFAPGYFRIRDWIQTQQQRGLI